MHRFYSFFLLFAVLCGTSLFGATCASLNLLDTASLTFNLPSYGPRGPSQTVNIINNAGNAYSISNGTHSHGFNSTPSQSGTGNAQIWVYEDGFADRVAPVNNQSDVLNFTINGTACTLSITYNVLTAVDRNARITNKLGISDSSLTNCTPGGNQILGCSQIPPATIASLPGGTNLIPANNTTAVETEFGTTIKNCSGTGQTLVHIYSSSDAMNADDSIIYAVSLPSGGQFMIDTATCTNHAVTLTGKNISTDPIFWDHTSGTHTGSPTTFWYYCGNQICQGVVNTSTWVVTITQPYTFAGSTNIKNGGTDDTSEDNWFVFWTDKDHAGSTAHPNVCLVEPSYSASPYAEHCHDYSIECPTCIANTVNYAMQSRGVSPFSNKRYVWIQDNVTNIGYLYSLTTGGTNLAFESNFGLQPEFPGGIPSGSAFNSTTMACPGTPTTACWNGSSHGHTVQDSAGHQYQSISPGQVNNDWFSQGTYTIDFDKCQASNSQLCTLPVALGGGLSISLWGPLGSWENGCVSGWCFLTMIAGIRASGLPGTDSWEITQATTSGGNIVLTLDAAPGALLVTNDPVYVGSVGANCPNANGAWAANLITVSGTSVTLPGKTCTSTDTGHGGIYKNVYPVTKDYSQEVLAYKYQSGASTQIYRAGVTLTADLSDDRVNAGYWMKVGCAPSHDLKYLVCNSNGGVPETSNILLMSINGIGIAPVGSGHGNVTSSGGQVR